ncbi:scavenger receptor class F member 1 isoform X2 [Lepisosteus oculatus]
MCVGKIPKASLQPCSVRVSCCVSVNTVDSEGAFPLNRGSTLLVCCPGWKQQGSDCPIPLCEGKRSCRQNEVCVYPGFCGCKPGFFGYECKMSCPEQFWGPDCRELCPCHPNGRCDPVTGQCTCLPSHWGAQCQHTCKCGRHGRCDPLHGNCTCEPGWWSPSCSKPCQCHRASASCQPATGKCSCERGFWGQKCSLACNCYVSPCLQRTGACQCLPGWWGPACDRRCNCNLSHAECQPASGECLCHPGYRAPFCNEPCAAGYYGSGCQSRCGHCKEGQPCSPVDGFCAACDPGWNGTRCDRPCPPGSHGELCQGVCPRCRDGEPCRPQTGECPHCDPGWTGPRCDSRCPNGTYGDRCRHHCAPCYHGRCDHVTGACTCDPGYLGESCNSTCTGPFYGINCSTPCTCADGRCHPVTGECQYEPGSRRALIAGLLIPLLLLLLGLACCCCCCGGGAGRGGGRGGSQTDAKDRLTAGDGTPAARMKHHVINVLANLSSAVPCLTLGSSSLPRVTVSHHDPEVTFNHSFIEPPSAGWVSENSFSSFETDEGESLYCLPPREDAADAAGGGFQEMSSKCNIFPDASAFNSEDVALPFAIPRTSSIAKSKRPSVSFAEGTKFAPEERRGSAAEIPGACRKPKSPWGALKLSTIQSQTPPGDGGVGQEDEEERPGESAPPEDGGSHPAGGDPDPGQRSSPPGCSRGGDPGGRRRTMSNAKRGVQAPAAGSDRITTVYVTVGRAAQPAKPEPGPEGPVQAMLRRLGSLQRQRDEATGRPRGRGESISKPPRRKLGARAGIWEQVAARGKEPTGEQQHLGSAEALTENTSLGRPASSVLKSVPESTAAEPEVSAKVGAAGDTADQSEGRYSTVGQSVDPVSLGSDTAKPTEDEGPQYENVSIIQP